MLDPIKILTYQFLYFIFFVEIISFTVFLDTTTPLF